jgi:cyclic pyranopterin phosphate synthase
MPETGVIKLKHEDVLTVEEIAEIVRASAACGITKVRVTGGEPLVRRGIVEICRRISQTQGISEVCLTTNAVLIPQYAEQLKAAGVNRLNISLDSLGHVTYNEITRSNTLDDALTGINTALKTGFDAIKINAVLIGGVNDKDIPELLELTLKHKVDVRFIELMPIGQCADWAKSRFISAQSVLKIAPELHETGTDGVTKLYKLPKGLGSVGLISPISSHFCPTCNRIRITADGTLKPCLHSAQEINLRGKRGKELENTIRDAISAKPQKHELNKNKQSSTPRNMNAIGG